MSSIKVFQQESKTPQYSKSLQDECVLCTVCYRQSLRHLIVKKRFEKANCSQDPEKRTTPLSSILLGRASFYTSKIDFRYAAVTKSIIFGVYRL